MRQNYQDLADVQQEISRPTAVIFGWFFVILTYGLSQVRAPSCVLALSILFSTLWLYYWVQLVVADSYTSRLKIRTHMKQLLGWTFWISLMLLVGMVVGAAVRKETLQWIVVNTTITLWLLGMSLFNVFLFFVAALLATLQIQPHKH